MWFAVGALHAGAMKDDFAILAAVAANPSHPYALLVHLQGLGLAATRSTLYRRVDALISQGWLLVDDVRGERGHYRRALSVSEAGRNRLEAEALSVLHADALESPMFPLAVAAATESGGRLVEVLRDRMAAAARTLTEEERSLREQDSEDWSRAGRERRIAHLQADIAWLQGLLGRRVVATADPDARLAG